MTPPVVPDSGDPVRVGFLGAGLIATFHSKMLRASGVPHERAGVYDPDRDRCESFVARAGGTVVGSEDEVLASCDAVYVCTWTAAHEELVERACDAGVAVFVEKPLGTDLAMAQRVATRLQEAGVIHQVGLILRYSPAYNLAADLLADSASTGRVMTAIFRDDQALPVRGRYASTWRGDPDLAGSGVLLEHSIHDLDLLDRLIGPVTSVNARQRFFHEIDGIEDLVVTTCDLRSGGVASLTTVWHDHIERNSLRRLEVHCERALVTVEEDWFGPVSLTVGGTTQTWEGEALISECERRGIPTPNPDGQFIEAVAAGRPAEPSSQVALRAHQLCDAVYRSAAEGGIPIRT